MPTITCAVCRREFEGAYANRHYCSAACKSKAWRARKKAQLADQAPRYDSLEEGLMRFRPKAGAKAGELRRRAGDECTELIFELVATMLKEEKELARKAEIVPMS
jgi:hypothetical protein